MDAKTRDWLRRSTDEELNRYFDRFALQSTFSKTPAWKQWVIWVFIFIASGAGLWGLERIIHQARMIELACFGIGILAVLAVWRIFQLEDNHFQWRKAVQEEIERRQNQ